MGTEIVRGKNASRLFKIGPHLVLPRFQCDLLAHLWGNSIGNAKLRPHYVNSFLFSYIGYLCYV